MYFKMFAYEICFDIYFRLSFGLANAINTYLRLIFVVVWFLWIENHWHKCLLLVEKFNITKLYYYPLVPVLCTPKVPVLCTLLYMYFATCSSFTQYPAVPQPYNL